MGKSTISLFVSALICLSACHSNDKHKSEETDTAKQGTVISTATEENKSKAADTGFDINTIPVTTQDIGVFPFFSAPEKNKYRNAATKDFDREYFAVHNKLIPVEGKSFKAELVTEQDYGTEFNPLLVEKNYEQIITSLGGVKVNAGPISSDERNRIGDKELLEKDYGYVAVFGTDDVSSYVIRTKDAEIWIQLQVNNAYGHIAIVQKGNLTPSISLIKAEELKKEIDAKGKAILHINFDTDKSTLKPEGLDAVAEIVKLLQQDGKLKLSIEGHTDDTGDKAHNLKLSEDRAKAVLAQIEKSGIGKDRLKAKGFGAETPIADNTTDKGKAENRRVELVKF
jgi:outer membrane protein OmpA-like peptidoglycan-associated protein